MLDVGVFLAVVGLSVVTVIVTWPTLPELLREARNRLPHSKRRRTSVGQHLDVLAYQRHTAQVAFGQAWAEANNARTALYFIMQAQGRQEATPEEAATVADLEAVAHRHRQQVEAIEEIERTQLALLLDLM